MSTNNTKDSSKRTQPSVAYKAIKSGFLGNMNNKIHGQHRWLNYNFFFLIKPFRTALWHIWYENLTFRTKHNKTKSTKTIPDLCWPLVCCKWFDRSQFFRPISVSVQTRCPEKKERQYFYYKTLNFQWRSLSLRMLGKEHALWLRCGSRPLTERVSGFAKTEHELKA